MPKEADIDMAVVLDMLERGATPPEIAKETGSTPPTIRQRIATLQKEQGVLLQYRTLQNLRLTELQHQILEAVTPGKIADAPLDVLMRAFNILKKNELLDIGKPTEIKGLMHYLVEVEKRELAGLQPVEGEVIEPEKVAIDGVPVLQ